MSPDYTEAGAGQAPEKGPDYTDAYHADVLNRYAASLQARASVLNHHTRRSYARALAAFCEWAADADLDGDPFTDAAARDWAARDWRSWALEVAKLSPGTVRVRLAGLSDAFAAIGPGSLSDVKRPTMPRLSPQALRGTARRRWDRAVALHCGIRNQALLGVMRYAGLRSAEAVGLDVSDVAMSARKAQMRVVGKGGKIRQVPVNAALRALLVAWLARRCEFPGAAQEPALFLARSGRRISTDRLADIVKEIASTHPDLEGVTPHILRHTFAAELVIDEGVDIARVGALMGHASADTTLLYTEPSESDLADAVEKITADR